MANIVRLAKSGNEWTFNELAAYNIVIHEQVERQFFGGPLPEYIQGPIGFIENEDRVQGLDAPSLALIKCLNLAMKIVEGEESTELMRAMGYETDQTVVRTRKSLQLLACGEIVFAKTDVCLMGASYENASSKIRLLIQEDKRHINPKSDPEAQLIAAAIAAFQQNNTNRVGNLFLEPLEVQVIPGITMVGTFPRFYKIKVTADLDCSVRFGQYPALQTIVYRYTPRVPGRRSDGMRPLVNRRLVLRCFEAFKKIVYSIIGISLCPLTIDVGFD
ncbi:hypothetical protein AX17_005435 [Amanita inopinata Kibby_2008]|nr:hypothetical protein AX17_005435 [Amanita inopinata Kibby_2008]